jgi:hypothetical protein
MGVHGMRSAHGAAMIQKMLTGHHTPESLVATIQGLQQFAQQFVKNTSHTAGATDQTATPAATSAPIRYDINGNPIK